MKEIVISIVVIVVVGAAAAITLNAMDWSAKSQFKSEQGNVRVR